MGVRILRDSDAGEACLYCSTSEWAFGPVFSASKTHGADERAEAFLRWLQVDPRTFTEQHLLERKYIEWLGQEAHQFQTEEAAA